MASIIRRDLNRFFLYWAAALNFLWVATPWLDGAAQLLGSVWLWSLVVPALCLALLNPRRTAGVTLALAALPWLMLRESARVSQWRTRSET